MAVKIKLKRLGRTRVPTYRIVVADARTKRDGRAIEEIGKYHPKEEPSLIEVNSERAQHWLSVGAQPTPPVMTILKITGDWQKFKGEPGAEGTLRVREQSANKKEVFAEALKSTGKDSSDSGSTTPKGGGRARKSDSKAKADTGTETKDAKPESGRSKSKATSERTAAGSADESAGKAATASADTASADTGTADTASADTAPADTASADTATADTASADTATADAASADTAPADAAPADAASVDTATADTTSADAAPADAASVDTATADTASTGASESSEPGSEA